MLRYIAIKTYSNRLIVAVFKQANMKKRNYYELLGVKKNASEKEIKTAFRKLARRLHPDVNDDPNADDQLAEINNAYETLMDKEKRAKYDASLFNPFTHFSQFSKSNAKNSQGFRWEDLKDKLGENSPFASNSFRFDDILASFRKKNKNNGNFNFSQNMDNDLNQYIDLRVELSSVYTGDSYNLKLNVPIRLPNGNIKHEEKQIKVNIPKGITEDKYIRLPKQGSVSLSGDNHGDLFLKIKFNLPENIKVVGSDVYQTINLFPWEMALGGVVKVATIAGEFAVNIPPCSNSGEQLRLRRKGIPSKLVGDLYLILNIVNPNMENGLTPQQTIAFQNLKTAFMDKKD